MLINIWGFPTTKPTQAAAKFLLLVKFPVAFPQLCPHGQMRSEAPKGACSHPALMLAVVREITKPGVLKALSLDR